MRNPYVTALVASVENCRQYMPAQPTCEKPALPERVSAFFEAMEIGHPGNRAKVCTAIAHTMKAGELAEAVRRLEADRAEHVTKLEELNAPEVILVNVRRKYQRELGILARVGRKVS